MNKKINLLFALSMILATPAFANSEAINNYYDNKKDAALAESYRDAREARMQERREAELFELQKEAIGNQSNAETLDDMQDIVDRGNGRLSEKQRLRAEKEQAEAIKELADETRRMRQAVQDASNS